MSGRRALRPTPWTDLAIALVLTAAGLLGTIPGEDGGGVVAAVTIPAVTLPVLLRRRAPQLASAAVAAGILVSALPTLDQWRCGVAIPAALLVLFTLAARCDLGPAARGLLAMLGAIVFLAYTDPYLDAGAIMLLLPLCAGVWAAGRLVASRARATAELQARTDALRRQRERTAQLAVEHERTRLSDQLDGAVRERMREIVALAERGERAPADDGAAARRAFQRIENAGRASLNEMRGLLGALRSDERAERAPRPTLAQLDDLLAVARADGRVVELDVVGEQRPLPGGLELAAYRIVEQALAGLDRGSARVRVRFAADALELEVEGGDPAGREAPGDPLLTAREHAAARGGSFTIRPAGPGRRTLCARLPLAVEHA